MSKDYSLSLSGAAFDRLRNDFDTTLRDVLAGMIDTDQNSAEINVKVKITLTDDSAPDFSVAGGQQTREITKPRFDHTVTYVIQRKEKKVGSFSGNYELVYDRDTGLYFFRDVDSGQTSIFDEDFDRSDAVDEEYTEIENGPRGLPEATESDDASEGEDVPDNSDGSVPDAVSESAEHSVRPEDDTSTPFGWLCQFIGEDLHISESLGYYTVRTGENKVVLSSATGEDSPFYCSAERLKPHIGHHVVCAGYGQDSIVNVSVECEDCSVVLFDIDAPESKDEPLTEDEVAEAMDAADEIVEEVDEEAAEEGSDEESEDSYKYEAPEA